MAKVGEAKAKSEMFEIRDILKTELNKFSLINSTLKETSEGFNRIGSNYNNYESEIDTSKNHIIKLKRREFFENLFIYVGFVIFFLCVAYVMLKRFPLHRIIFALYSILEYIVNFFTSSISTYMMKGSYSNSTLNDTYEVYTNIKINNTIDL